MAVLRIHNKELKIKIVDVMNYTSSNGLLQKWQAEDIFGRNLFIKSHSKGGYECEAEVAAFQIGRLMGLNTLEYTLGELQIDRKNHKVVVSEDMAVGGEVKALSGILPNASKYLGKEKYEYIVKSIPYIRDYLDQILIFDAIINNPDRHLGNIALISTNSGLVPAPIYDSGASLFSGNTLEEISKAFKTPLNHSKSKPFLNTHPHQLRLVSSQLTLPSTADISTILYANFTPDRARLLLSWVINSIQQMGDYLYDGRA